MSLDLIVTGKLATHDKVYDNISIGIKDGKVVARGEKSSLPEAKEYIDAGSNIILPGIVDAHVHSLGDADEGHENSTRAAAAGGVTTINDHPLDIGGAPSSTADIQAKDRKMQGECYVDYSLFAEARPDKLDDIKEVADAGITGYKTLMQSTSGASLYEVRANTDAEMYIIANLIAECGQRAYIHAESETIIAYLIDKYEKEGKVYPLAHCETRPECTETLSVAMLIEIARDTGCNMHFVHLSLPRSFELVKRAKADGIPVTAETCTHYLICNESRWEQIGSDFRINPALRSEEARLALWKQLADGDIDLVGSDHAPHPPKRCENIFDAFSGAPGIEATLPLLYSEGVNAGRITVNDLVRVTSYNPARLLGLYPTKGHLDIGADADFVLFDPNKKWTMTASEVVAQSGWTLYEGMDVTGKLVSTHVRGTKVFENGKPCVPKGFGRFIKAKKGGTL
ncbi:amidohydrolase family protein [Oscillospiraceae bacterium OttesenSCG-928-G22]|nr:amidohydrolase family protein [Oscillospiraceae bacterium OttesenSCG-928-G22]